MSGKSPALQRAEETSASRQRIDALKDASTAEGLVMPLNVREIEIDLVDAGGRLRTLDPRWVQTLAENIEAYGQQSPVEAVAVADRYRLVFGAHRLAAIKSLGRRTILAVVKPAAAAARDIDERLREIAENLVRRELSVLDHAVHVAAWREIYETIKPVPKRGRPKTMTADKAAEEMSAKFVTNFSEAAQAAMGVSRRAVFRALKIASIAPELRDRIAAHPIAGNQSELLTLAAETPARQASIVALLVAEEPRASTVAEAIAIIDKLPPAERLAPFERLADGFARLKPAERDRFFELHAEDIEAWIARRHTQKPGGGLMSTEVRAAGADEPSILDWLEATANDDIGGRSNGAR